MAYIVVSFKGQEVGRWPLEGPIAIGRSTECQVVVRDILLSRRHCQITPYRSGWIALDLDSKNGTKCEGRRITRRGLGDGDVLTMGKTTVRFQIGRLATTYKPPAKRPADPFEALSGTVTEFDPKEVEAFQRKNNMPAPRPMPKDPAAFASEDLYSLLTEIASSSWDSIYAQASRPRRPIPRSHLVPQAIAPSGGPAIVEAPKSRPASPTKSIATIAKESASVETMPRRSRLAFSEELQIEPALMAEPGVTTESTTLAEPALTRLVRPADPLSVDLEVGSGAWAAGESSDSLPRLPAPEPTAPPRRRGALRRTAGVVFWPFVMAGRILRML